MNIAKFYNNLVLNGRKLFFLFFVTALVLRLVFLLSNIPFVVVASSDSYLWTKIEPLTNSHLYLSLGLAFFSVFLISLLTNIAGVSVSMLRVKSILPAAMIFLLFSCNAVYFIFTSYVLLAVVFSFILFIIYNNFNTVNKEYLALRVGFYTSIASAISSSFIYFIPILFICLYLSRNFSFKCSVSFVLGYVPFCIFVFVTSLYLGEIDTLSTSILSAFQYQKWILPLLQFDVFQYCALGLSIVTAIMLIFSNKLKNVGEKVVIRICLNILAVIQIYSLILMILVPGAFFCGLSVLLVSFSLNLSYFYISVKNKKLLLGILFFNYISILVINIVARIL